MCKFFPTLSCSSAAQYEKAPGERTPSPDRERRASVPGFAPDFAPDTSWKEAALACADCRCASIPGSAPDFAPPSSSWCETGPDLENNGGATSLQHADEDGRLVAGLAMAVANMASLAAEAAKGESCFDYGGVPPLSLEAYAARLHQYLGCSGTCYVLALIYLDRIVLRCPDLVVSEFTCHRLLLASIVVAAKFHDDSFYSNRYYSNVGGVQLQEMNRLEMRFLELLEWHIRVDPEEYGVYRDLCAEASSGASSAMPARCF